MGPIEGKVLESSIDHLTDHHYMEVCSGQRLIITRSDISRTMMHKSALDQRPTNQITYFNRMQVKY